MTIKYGSIESYYVIKDKIGEGKFKNLKIKLNFKIIKKYIFKNIIILKVVSVLFISESRSKLIGK